jgi:hypothetical protein
VPASGWFGEFSWFSGTLWRLVLCGGCYTHLGWEFTGAAGSEGAGNGVSGSGSPAGGTSGEGAGTEGGFYGLIIPKLNGIG